MLLHTASVQEDGEPVGPACCSCSIHNGSDTRAGGGRPVEMEPPTIQSGRMSGGKVAPE